MITDSLTDILTLSLVLNIFIQYDILIFSTSCELRKYIYSSRCRLVFFFQLIRPSFIQMLNYLPCHSFDPWFQSSQSTFWLCVHSSPLRTHFALPWLQKSPVSKIHANGATMLAVSCSVLLHLVLACINVDSNHASKTCIIVDRITWWGYINRDQCLGNTLSWLYPKIHRRHPHPMVVQWSLKLYRLYVQYTLCGW